MPKILLSESQRIAIELHIMQEYPKEACGLLTEHDYIPCRNLHETPEKAFRFDRLEFAINYKSATALIHSHCRDPRKPVVFDPKTPSYADMLGQRRTKLPWLIFECEGVGVYEPLQFPRIPNTNYIGRPFIWFINDCYTLVQDWYRFELGIELQDYKLDKDYEDIRNLDGIFAEHIESYGFQEVPLEFIQVGDLLLVDNAGFKENHLAIYTDSGVLHQDMLSVTVPFQHFLGRINKVLRYVN
jgi:proteasome lid subunit RPN8/RPN11